MVVTGTGIVRLDEAVVRTLPPPGGTFFDFGDTFTAVFSPWLDGAVLLATGCFLAVKRRSRAPVLAAGWAVTVVTVVVLDLKYAIGRDGEAHFTALHGQYPSGHTAAAAVLLSLAVLMALRGRARIAGLAAIGVLTALVGTCLVYDRYHWLSDVVASLLLTPLLLWWALLTPAGRRAVGPKHPPSSDSE